MVCWGCVGVVVVCWDVYWCVGVFIGVKLGCVGSSCGVHCFCGFVLCISSVQFDFFGDYTSMPTHNLYLNN